jgi:hypothetical protein
MKFTQDGKHVLTIGEPGVNKGSNDPDHLGGPANFYVEPKTNELFIADGYINKRVVVYDADRQVQAALGRVRATISDTEKCGAVKLASPRSSSRCTASSAQGRAHYVSDRRGNRIQVFRQNGDLMETLSVRKPAGRERLQPAVLARSRQACSTSSTARTSACDPAPKDLAILDRFGRPGRRPASHPRAHDRHRLEEPDGTGGCNGRRSAVSLGHGARSQRETAGAEGVTSARGPGNL